MRKHYSSNETLVKNFDLYCLKNCFPYIFITKGYSQSVGKTIATKKATAVQNATRSGVPLSLYNSDDVIIP